MILNKRILRNIKKNKSFYIGLILLCITSVTLLVGVQMSVKSLTDITNEFYDETNVEDASFYTLLPIDKENLELKFDVQIERMEYIDIKQGERTIRVFKETEKINKLKVISGDNFSSTGQILMNSAFAKENDLAIGENYKIEKNNFKIVGLFTRPDYLYVIKSLTDILPNNKTFGIALLKEGDFNKLNSKRNYYYSVKFKNTNVNKFKKYVNDSYNILQFTSNENNMRINHIYEEIKQLEELGFMIPPFLIVLTMIFIAVVLSRMIKKEYKQIGTLVALGYSKKELMKHYMVYSMITSIIGSLLGILIGKIMIKPFEMIISIDFNFPLLRSEVDITTMIIGFFIPVIILNITAILVIYTALNKKSIDLLNSESFYKTSNVKIFSAKLKFSTKFKLRAVIRNAFRSLMFTFGIFGASLLCLAGFIVNSSVNSFIDKDIKLESNYEYSYYFKDLQQHKIIGGEVFLTQSFETENVEFSILGIQQNSKYIKLKTLNGEEVSLDGVYISRPLAEILKVNDGDKLTFKDPNSLKEYSINIDKVVDIKVGKNIYMNINRMNKLLKYEKNSSNGVFSSNKLNFDEDRLLTTIENKDIIESYDSILDQFKALVGVFVVFSMFIGIIIIFVSTNMIIEENVNNISMLKVLGYKNKEINKLIIDINIILIILGFIIALPCSLMAVQHMFEDSVKNMSICISPSISITDAVISYIIIYGTYKFSLFLLRSKIVKISMIESLKSSRDL